MRKTEHDETVAWPRDAIFSTLSMSATHFWNEEPPEWRPILDDDEPVEARYSGPGHDPLNRALLGR